MSYPNPLRNIDMSYPLPLPLREQIVDIPYEDSITIDFNIKYRSFTRFITYIVNRACERIILRTNIRLDRLPDKYFKDNIPDFEGSDVDRIYFKFSDREYCIRLWCITTNADDTKLIGHATVFDDKN
jgi:hypothetical protein